MKQVLQTFITLLVCSAILHAQVDALSDVPLFLGSSDSDPYYQSVVVPLNSQNGVKLDRLGNNQFSETVPWFHRIQKTSRKYITVTGDRVDYDVEVENPIVAFGSLVGGSPLHVNQEYRFLISVGAKLEAADSVQQAEVVISAYSKNSFLGNRNQIPPEHRFSLKIPQRGTPQWTQFVANGSLLEISDPVTGLDASLAFDESSNEEENPKTPYLFTLRATNADYYFTVEAQGTCKVGNRWHPVTKKIHGHDPPPREILFCLNFECKSSAIFAQ